MKIELNLLKGFIIKYAFAFISLMILLVFIGYVQSVLPEESIGESILYGVMIFLTIVTLILISVLGLYTLFVDKPEYYIVRYKTRFDVFKIKSIMGICLFAIVMIIFSIIKHYIELWNEVNFVIDFLMTDYRYRPGEIHRGNILSALFLFKLMSSYSLSNQLKIRYYIPTYILTSFLYLVLFLAIFIMTFFVEPEIKFIYIYLAIAITYVWEYILIVRSDI